ncbi:putative nucleolar GTP-binding protein [Helianthus annuus]|nr:putative nucleolar GTP-binding protein [Helianthus annuus]
MYNTRPKRDAKGTILKYDLQSNELPSTHIQPDRRWFGNTRVVNQKELEFFREELQTRMSSSYNVILKEWKLPMSLLNDHQKQTFLIPSHLPMHLDQGGRGNVLDYWRLIMSR